MTSSSPDRTRRVRLAPEARREQILQQASRLIAESGFNAVSLADVGEACGIAKASVLHYYPTMNDLLLAVILHREEQDFFFYMDDAVDGPAQDPPTARERFTRVFRRNLERPEIVRLYVVLSAEALAADHPAHAYFGDRARQARTEVQQHLSWKADPTLAAAEFLAFWDGLELAWRHDADLDVLGVWNNFCDRFFA